MNARSSLLNLKFAEARDEIRALGFNLKRGGDERADGLHFKAGSTIIFADSLADAVKKARQAAGKMEEVS